MYMAPEFYTGENPTYDKSVDVFAMGMLFLTMINAEKGKPLLSPKTGKAHSYNKTSTRRLHRMYSSCLEFINGDLLPLLHITSFFCYITSIEAL